MVTIFEPKRDEVPGEWSKLHNEELHILYSSADIIRQIKLRRIEVGGTCGTHWRGKCARFGWESQREGDHLEDQGVDGRVGSECILGR
jgi:hypothetical protein